MKPKHDTEVLIEGERRIKIQCEPRDLFSVVKGLQNQSLKVEIRTFDEEMNDWTCWQPTTLTG